MELATVAAGRVTQRGGGRGFDITVLSCDIHEFDVHVTVHRDTFLIINQLDALISQIYFGMKLCMFRTGPLSIIRSTHSCTHSNGICYIALLTACEQEQDGMYSI